MPDPGDHIADDIAHLGRTTTAEDLIKQRGGQRKVQVMSKKVLMDYIQRVVSEVRSRHADKLTDAERAEIESQAGAKMQEVMARARDMEQTLKRKEQERQELEAKLAAGGMDDFDRQLLIGELQQRLADAEYQAEERMQDLLVVEDELQKVQNLYQAALSERDSKGDSNKQFVLKATDLVQAVIGLDHDYYADRHQEANPAADDVDDPMLAFFHDFTVCADVVQSLAADLTRMREITQGAASQAGAGLLEEDLALLQQLKEGSLNAMDVAEPVASLVESAQGLQGRVLALAKAVESAGKGAVPAFTGLPDPDDDPPQVLARLSTVLREFESVVGHAAAAGFGRSEPAGSGSRIGTAMRQQMIRMVDLVQTVLTLDQTCYGGRFQEEISAEQADAEGEDAFFADFEVVEVVVQQLLRDLERLHALVESSGAGEGVGIERDLDGVAKLRQLAGGTQVLQNRASGDAALEPAVDSLLEGLVAAAKAQGHPIDPRIEDRDLPLSERRRIAARLLGLLFGG